MKNKGDIFIAKSKSGTSISEFGARGVGKKLVNFGRTFVGITHTGYKVVVLIGEIEKIAKFILIFLNNL